MSGFRRMDIPGRAPLGDDFLSYDAFLDYIDDRARAWRRKHKTEEAGERHRYDSAVEFALESARAGMDIPPMSQVSVESLTARAVAEGPAPAYVPDVCGEVIDIGAAIAGEPESMVAYRSAPTLTGVVRILINRVGSAGTSDAMVAKVGAMACALCQTIECLGRPLEVWTVAALRRHGEQGGPGQPASHELLIRVKAGGEPIDPRRLAYAMGNRQWERTLEFFYLDSHDDARVRAYGEADDYAIGAKSYAESSLVIPHLYGTLATKVTVAQLEDQMLVWLRNAGVLMSKADE